MRSIKRHLVAGIPMYSDRTSCVPLEPAILAGGAESWPVPHLFADEKKLDVAVGTLARYEIDVQSPRAKVLRSLADLARRNGFQDLADSLHHAYTERVTGYRVNRAKLTKETGSLLRDARIAKEALPGPDTQGYAYKVLWTLSLDCLARAREKKDRFQADVIAATVLGYACFESYVAFMVSIIEAQHPDVDLGSGPRRSYRGALAHLLSFI